MKMHFSCPHCGGLLVFDDEVTDCPNCERSVNFDELARHIFKTHYNKDFGDEDLCL